ncbi:peptidase [Tsukamurella tyrosinosolvens]|uniref:DUF2268 domain-containing protein n=1 Tax=Tsukamurella tyrosinosolvens TaxID=57704 RepID=UPI00079B37BB|nr:DUF2268 domain-containing putative Zn-dependent protease [Tsukamurella tyrosinosolvens]KXP06037.1 peptidase [Tsukamurella tyrosinosolvens]KZL95868.1 peptidase [Tsukamurella tyrosinosolvens]MCA4993321.1 peptidase [Tsukamurella tyrosinosolvens]WEL95127.1 DUF2268 domain-containing putative Zn-dependent protease [Tsukamurella tyrosinosolvens]
MKITVLDTYAAMHEILHAPAGERAALLEEMWRPVAGMYRYFPGPVDLVAMHAASSGFPLDRDTEACLDAIELLRAADAWGRIERALRSAADRLAESLRRVDLPEVTVLLVVGDPGDRIYLDEALGLTANGSVTGYLYLNVWPSPENLDRVEAMAVHEFDHNVRYAPGGVVWDPATVTVGEQIVSEGLADALARELYGDALGRARIGVPHRHDDALYARVTANLGITGMQNFASWVLGDAIAGRFGAPPIGIPTGAGYAVGNRLVDAYLAATGLSASEAVHADAREIIATAS